MRGSISHVLVSPSGAGFRHFSLGADEAHSTYLTLARQRHLCALAEQHGLSLDSIHGPRADKPESLAALSRAVIAAAEFGVPILVVHGSPFDFTEAELEDRVRQVVRTCKALAPVLAASRVRLAFGNRVARTGHRPVCWEKRLLIGGRPADGHVRQSSWCPGRRAGSRVGVSARR
jgi:sugar phosphate isomerase/epimerase